MVSGATLSSDTGVVVSARWDASLLGAADGSAVEVRVVGHRSGGYLNPALGRFASVDSVQPNAPGTEGYNLHAYVANNATTWGRPRRA